MLPSTSYSHLLPIGLSLNYNEILVLLCFESPISKLCFPDCGLSQKDTTSCLLSLISKQLIVKRQYYNLTKKGKTVRAKLNHSHIEVN